MTRVERRFAFLGYILEMAAAEESFSEALEEGTSSFGGAAQQGVSKPSMQQPKGNKFLGNSLTQKLYSFRATVL